MIAILFMGSKYMRGTLSLSLSLSPMQLCEGSEGPLLVGRTDVNRVQEKNDSHLIFSTEMPCSSIVFIVY